MSGTESLRLVCLEGDVQPSELVLEGADPIVLGRDPGSDLRVGDRRASSRHAHLVPRDDGWWIEDLDSSSGTRLDGVEVEAARLIPGARIQIGRATLEVVGDRPSAADGPLLRVLCDLLAGGPGDMDARLEGMLDRLVAAFGADRACLLAPGEGDGLAPVLQRSRGDEGPGAELHISRTLLERVLREGEARLLTSLDLERVKEEHGSVPEELRSVLVAPLPRRELPGALYLDSLLERRSFDEGDRSLLLGFARAAAEVLDAEADRRRLSELARRTQQGGTLVGEHPSMEVVRDEIRKAAVTDVTVLVRGETGTGKELVAGALHRESSRGAGPFVPLNCASIPSELLESELFGHEKGAFSGAHVRRLGRFELAAGGTLFLDEVGELPLDAQAKLLRALEERRIRRVGGDREIPVDFRLVCATHRDLEEEVRAGRFREDLLYRIRVFTIRLPPLRERGDDVLLLAREFLRSFSRIHRRTGVTLTPAAEAALTARSWPGNVRELRSQIEVALIRCEGTAISAEAVLDAPAAAGSPSSGGGDPWRAAAEQASAAENTLEAARHRLDGELVRIALERAEGNVTRAAKRIGLTRRNFYVKCKEHGIDPEAYRP